MKPSGKYIVTLAVLLLAVLAAGGYLTRPRPQAQAVQVYLAPLNTRPDSYLGVTEVMEKAAYRPIMTFAWTVGRKPNIVLTYSGWNEGIPLGLAGQAHAHGAMLLDQINPGHVPMAAIAAGKYDTFLKSFADQVRGFGYRVILSFAGEMNGDWDPWGYHHTRPAVWIAAWRHVVTVFRSQHASNVVWLWTVNRHGPTTGPIHLWWPGRNYVTWVGIDGYYFLKTDTFTSCFGKSLAAVRNLTRKPVLLAEVGIGQVADQASKIPGLFEGIKQHQLLGVVWFDQAQHGSLYKQDWRLEGHPKAISAFRRGLRLIGYR